MEWLRTGPAAILGQSGSLPGPSEMIEQFEPVGECDIPHSTGGDPDLGGLAGWIGNAMQSDAMRRLHRLEAPVKARAQADPQLLEDWRELTASQHFLFMRTRADDPDAAAPAWSPYDSPYDAYINYMNVLEDLAQRTCA